MDKFKHYDILTLKKLVIEEIKNELELAGHGKQVFPGISRPGYVDPFTRTDMTIAQASLPGDRIQIKGEKFLNEEDDA
jgi:hypothetical protein